jgi:hypothetical protein
MVDLLELFQTIRPSTGEGDALPARRVPSFPQVWLGKGEANLPIVIVENASDGPLPTSLVLRNLRFDPSLECKIKETDSRRHLVIRAAVIRLTSQEPELVEYFLRTIGLLLAETAQPLGTAELGRAIDRLAEIFRALSFPSPTSLQGLWAEMLLIRNANSVSYAVQVWHPTRRSLFDFEVGNEALEVKSTTTGIRRHHFKLAQIDPPAQRRIHIVSIMLTPTQSGPSIPDLWRDIERKLTRNPQLQSRLAEVIGQSAGADWKHAHGIRFDDDSARRSILVFAANVIPRPGYATSPEVSEIEFVSDLSSTPSLDLAALANPEGLLAAFL